MGIFAFFEGQVRHITYFLWIWPVQGTTRCRPQTNKSQQGKYDGMSGWVFIFPVTFMSLWLPRGGRSSEE
jgi:hypothetical protein